MCNAGRLTSAGRTRQAVIPRICGQNGVQVVTDLDKPGERPVRHADAVLIGMALVWIGWPLQQLSRRSGYDRHEITRWMRKGGMPEPFRAWLIALQAVHVRYPTPLALSVRPGGNRPPLGKWEVLRAQLVIGWSERQLAEKLGEHRTALRRRLDGGETLDARESRWLELLEDGHRLNPRP